MTLNICMHKMSENNFFEHLKNKYEIKAMTKFYS